MKIIKYFKSFKDFVPTWIICVFMFVGAFIWPLVIGIILLIIQCIQKNKIKKHIQLLEQGCQQASVLSQNLRDKEYEINKLNKEIVELKDIVSQKESTIKQLQSSESDNIDQKQKERIEKILYYQSEIEKTGLPSGFEIINAQNNALIIQEEYDQKKKNLEDDFKEKYSEYRERYSRIQSEIRTIKEEMRLLNNKVIEQYYLFSDYDGINSQDCRNQLSVLKAKEKELRNSEGDIRIIDFSEKKKLVERSIRQILRNFNSDCENIMSNIGIKNIDLVRNRIQKSYETLNKMYAFDGISLSEKLLSLKLDQATLLYTYELKRQQEKEIQQAIKEQMMEEARAEREIQEQKKKIEKDLQQHMSEIKRIMKYMQSSQIDAERQLYLDKIKELEAKVKSLESDKETVIEREANAKAGFVYIISNIGSFGEDIYKIGMTRRLEPMDRIRELSSASVPFEFDVHAMIFSSDAPAVETMLHKHFEKYAVNKVNPRKEFYRINIDEIEKVVLKEYNNTVQFTKVPLATEYRQSIAIQNKGIS